jgi:hypothetical protein
MAMFYDMEFTGTILFALFGLTLMLDAGVGMHILHQIFSSRRENVDILEGFLTEEQ